MADEENPRPLTGRSRGLDELYVGGAPASRREDSRMARAWAAVLAEDDGELPPGPLLAARAASGPSRASEPSRAQAAATEGAISAALISGPTGCCQCPPA